MEVINKINYDPEQALKIVKNAFEKAYSEGVFRNNLIDAVKSQPGLVIIHPKTCVIYDPILLKIYLELEYPKGDYFIMTNTSSITIKKRK